MVASEKEEETCLISKEVAHVLAVLAMRNNPMKEDSLKRIGSIPASSSSTSFSSSPSYSSPPSLTIEIQRLEWRPQKRTLYLAAYPEVNLYASSSSSSSSSSSFPPNLTRAQQLLLSLPLELEIFFPSSPSEPPFCFSTSDAGALVAERVNSSGSLLPLDRSSLLHAVSKITAIIKQEVNSIWPPESSGEDEGGRKGGKEGEVDYRRDFARALCDYLEKHVIAADLMVALLSMSKMHHNPTIKAPVPRFFYQREGSLTINQPALSSAIAAIPPLEVFRERGREGERAASGLSFGSCVLLHHLFFRERVTVVDGRDGGREEGLRPEGQSLAVSPSQPRQYSSSPYSSSSLITTLLSQAGFNTATSTDLPCMVFPLHHAQDSRFTALSERHGTCYGFHGSPPTNFFSIVSLGLRGLSGTKGMRNGAVFGDGVYVASKCEVARNFGGWGVPVWRHSRFGVVPGGRGGGAVGGGAPLFAYQIIALCEFIDLPQYRCGLMGGGSSGTSAPSTSTCSSDFSSSSSSSGSPPTVQHRRGSNGTSSSSNSSSSEYWVVGDDAHLVVRALLLFKDPAVLRGPPPLSASSSSISTVMSPRQNINNNGQHPLPPLPRPPVAQRHIYLQFIVWIVRVVLFGVALIIFLETVEKLWVRRGASWGLGKGRKGRRSKGW